MMASVAPRVLTPSCRGSKKDLAGGPRLKAKHLATRRLSTSPTAMGQKDQASFLLAAWIVAPQKKGATSGGSFPEATKLTNLVSEVNVLAPFKALGQPEIDSFRKEARRPEGPGAVPAGKDKRALVTSSSEMMVEGRDSGGKVGGGA